MAFVTVHLCNVLILTFAKLVFGKLAWVHVPVHQNSCSDKQSQPSLLRLHCAMLCHVAGWYCELWLTMKPLLMSTETRSDEHACGRWHDGPLHLHPDGPHPHCSWSQDSQRLDRNRHTVHLFKCGSVSMSNFVFWAFFYLKEGKIGIRWIWICRRRLVWSGLISLRRRWTYWFQFTKVKSTSWLTSKKIYCITLRAITGVISGK